MVPIVANKPEEQLKDSILHNLSYTELDQFQDNGSLISLDENFIKYNDDDRNRANSIISTSSAFSCLPSDNNSSLKLMVPGIHSNSRVDYLRSRQSGNVGEDDNIKLVERSKLTGIIGDKNNNDDSNNDIPPLTIDTEPVSFVQSFLSLFSPSRKVNNNNNDNNDNPDVPITPESHNPDTPTTFNRQLNHKRRLSWSENTIKDDENFMETRVRRDSISSQTTMATDDGTFVSYYTFQSNVIKALLYEV